MIYRITDAFNVKNVTLLGLDRDRDVFDLGSSISLIEGIEYKVIDVHPKKFVTLEHVEKPEYLIGKNIELIP